MSLISVLVAVIVIVIIVFAAVWIIDQTMPAPAQLIAKVIVGLLALIGVLALLSQATGVSALIH